MKRLVLAGAGHAHALVLRELAQRQLPGVEVVVVSPQPLVPYSGMVPGWLAGTYRFADIVVNVPPLACAAHARWLVGEVQALDADSQQITLTDGTALAYDVLSLNVGSTLLPPQTKHAQVLPLRPLALLRERFDRLLALWQLNEGPADGPFVVTALGGGPAAFEALLAVLKRLRQMRPHRQVQGQLITRSSALLPGLAPRAQLAAYRALRQAGVVVQLDSDWCEAVDLGSHLVLWATGAQAHDWLRDGARRGGLAVDEAGFVCIDAQLRSVSHAQIFATGDCASWPGQALPKAGVHAVRMAPVLAHNLRAALVGGGQVGALQTYHPQRHFLALLATADGRAIAARGAWAFEGAWAWHLKDHIDRHFVGQFGAS